MSSEEYQTVEALTLEIVSPVTTLKALTLNVISQATIPPSLTPTIPTIISDLQQKKRILKYTLAIFLERARMVHGDKFSYSLIKEEYIKGWNSKIPLICNTCKYGINGDWNTVTVHKHINEERGCPSCSGRIPWTFERFLSQSKSIHSDKFNYSLVTKDYIQGSKSKIPLICNTCSYGIEGEWITSISSHIYNGTGCPNCAGNVPWTISRFLKVAKSIHLDKYNYSLLNEEYFKGQESKIPVICNTCTYGLNGEWNPSINHHINTRSGCPNCAQKIPWTLERFLHAAHFLHEDKYDYSLVTSSHIEGVKSKIPLICNTCKYGSFYEWNPSISCHINHKYGCPNCAGNAPWTLERFLSTAKDIHANRYNYSHITSEHMNGASSKIPVICNICTRRWDPTITNHINNKSGCPHCSMSKGELMIADILTEMNIMYDTQHTIPTLPGKRYDFMFVYENADILIEFDGIQHFQQIPFFSSSLEDYAKRQQSDVEKTYHAAKAGYYLIRIDYKQINCLREHITKALQTFNNETRTYFSTPEMYQHISCYCAWA